MKRKKYLLFIILTIVPGLLGGAISNYVFVAKTAVAQESNLFPGLELYIPTKLEWLVLYLQANAAYNSNESEFNVFFSMEKPDTVVIVCHYSPTVRRSLMNSAIERCRQYVRLYAERYGWQDWVKIKEHIQMVD